MKPLGSRIHFDSPKPAKTQAKTPSKRPKQQPRATPTPVTIEHPDSNRTAAPASQFEQPKSPGTAEITTPKPSTGARRHRRHLQAGSAPLAEAGAAAAASATPTPRARGFEPSPQEQPRPPRVAAARCPALGLWDNGRRPAAEGEGWWCGIGARPQRIGVDLSGDRDEDSRGRRRRGRSLSHSRPKLPEEQAGRDEARVKMASARARSSGPAT